MWLITVHVLDIRLDWLWWKSFFQLPPPPRVPSSVACTSICSRFWFSWTAPLLGKFIVSELNDGIYYSIKADMDHSLSRAISAICIVVLLPSKQRSGSAAKIGVQLFRQELMKHQLLATDVYIESWFQFLYKQCFFDLMVVISFSQS